MFKNIGHILFSHFSLAAPFYIYPYPSLLFLISTYTNNEVVTNNLSPVFPDTYDTTPTILAHSICLDNFYSVDSTSQIVPFDNCATFTTFTRTQTMPNRTEYRITFGVDRNHNNNELRFDE